MGQVDLRAAALADPLCLVAKDNPASLHTHSPKLVDNCSLPRAQRPVTATSGHQHWCGAGTGPVPVRMGCSRRLRCVSWTLSTVW